MGIDMGGLANEFFFLLSEALFDKQKGLFVEMGPNHSFLHPNSFLQPDQELYKFIGKFIAKSIIEGKTVTARFSNIMYKMLSNRSISFDDLELFDPNLYE